VKIKNLETGKMVTVDQKKFDYAIKKPIAVQYQRIPFAFEVETLEGNHTASANDVLIVGVRGEPYPCEKSIFNETYGDMEFATPHFQELSTGDFVNLAIKRGAKPTEAGKALQVIEDIKQITDGKKPVYVVEFAEWATPEYVEAVNYMCVRCNLAVILVPKGEMNIIGEVVPD
jgi:hypothetical protein